MNKVKFRRGGQIIYIPAEMIKSDPMRPRTYYNEEELAQLTASIAESGIIKPLTVRTAKKEGYFIISGERRYKAAVKAGIEAIPCILIKMSDEDAAFTAIEDNLRQSNLNFFEIPSAAKKIHEQFYCAYDVIADRLGITLNELMEKMKLLSIPEDLRKKIIESGITERHTKELIKLNDEDKEKLINEIIENRLNVTKTQQRCREILYSHNPKKQKTVTYFKDSTIFVNTIDKAIDTMQRSGIKAESSKREEESYYEYRVLIPK